MQSSEVPASSGTGQTAAHPPVYTSSHVSSVFADSNQTPAPANQNQAMPPSPPPMPEATDGDVIEKAWVQQVEQIIKQYRFDPHGQQLALCQLNQAYLKQRFNLSIASAGKSS